MSYFTDVFDEKIIEFLKDGGIGFMPSDTVYGISALALNEVAVEKVYSLKKRADHKPCIILLARVDQAKEVGINPKELEPIKEFWPAPVTFIASANGSPIYLHKGYKTLAVRIPDKKKLRELISRTGPLVSTSANLQGQPVINSVANAKETFGNKLDFYVDIGSLSGEPSTIAKYVKGDLKIVRQGAWQIPS